MGLGTRVSTSTFARLGLARQIRFLRTWRAHPCVCLLRFARIGLGLDVSDADVLASSSWTLLFQMC